MVDEITILTSLDNVRRRPGMYFGDEQDASNHVVMELVANVVDQFLAGRATRVSVTTGVNEIVVEDDGPGMSLDSNADLDRFLSLHHAASRDGHAPHTHIALHGVGLAAVNAIAKRMRVESRGKGVEFCRGRLVDGPFDLPQKRHGTRIEWQPDRTIWDIGPPDERLREKMIDATHFFPGLTLTFNDEVFQARQGLLDFCRRRLPGHAPDCLSFLRKEMVGDILIHAAGLFDDSNGELAAYAYCNGVANTAGGHLDAIRAVASGLSGVCVVHVIMFDPHFAGPTREKIRHPDLARVVTEVLRKAMPK